MPEFALAALARERAELDGEIVALVQRVERLRVDLAHLDAMVARATDLTRNAGDQHVVLITGVTAFAADQLLF